MKNNQGEGKVEGALKGLQALFYWDIGVQNLNGNDTFLSLFDIIILDFQKYVFSAVYQ